MRIWKSKKRRRYEEDMRELARLRRENHERHHSPFAVGGEIPRRSPDESDKSLFLLDPGCVIPERDPKRMKATLDTLNQPLWKRAGLSEDEATHD